MRRFTEFARAAKTWALRLAVSCLMLTGFLPTPLLLVYLEWLHECLAPDHPGMATVLLELVEVRERYGRSASPRPFA